MPLKMFTIPAHDDGSAAETLNQFVSSVRVVTVEKRFVEDGEDSFWAICVNYLSSATNRPTLPRREKADYREILPESEFAVYAKLRLLRKQLSDREGVPAYALFTNEQMAAMVRGRVSTPSALKTIPGVGDARIEKYAAAFLDLLRPHSPQARRTPRRASDQTAQRAEGGAGRRRRDVASLTMPDTASPSVRPHIGGREEVESMRPRR